MPAVAPLGQILFPHRLAAKLRRQHRLHLRQGVQPAAKRPAPLTLPQSYIHLLLDHQRQPSNFSSMCQSHKFVKAF
jgi:hypothetical protein